MAASREVTEEIRADIAELRAALDAGAELSAETRVTGLAALVNAKTVLLAVERFEGHKDGVKYDVIRPLTEALAQFPEAARALTAALGRLPAR
jgi:hypothetical protein